MVNGGQGHSGFRAVGLKMGDLRRIGNALWI
jgi:hypothetical protein